MKILFTHQNFPGQYLHVARYLASVSGNEVVFVTQRKDVNIPGIKKLVYSPKRKVTPGIHHYISDVENSILNAQEVARAANAIKQSGFTPDIMLGHNGWGEIWYLKDIFPSSPLIGYFEFYYRSKGADVAFDPKTTTGLDTGPRVRTKNLGNLLGLEAVDAGQCPTQWQKSLYPRQFQSMLHVAHEGVDTETVKPNPSINFKLKDVEEPFSFGDEIVTYVARNLETYRGFEVFMRSLPEILQKRPKARVLIIGGDGVSYGPRRPPGPTLKEEMLKELEGSIDMKRVHFLGKLPYSQYLKILQVSRVHVYLTYPFVLSWSMLEAMSAGCLIVGSKTQPVEEVIRHGENGLLVDFHSAEAVAASVVEALSDPRAYSALRSAARETVIQNYDLKTICLPAHLRMINLFLSRKLQLHR